MSRIVKFEYGFLSVNGIVKKVYELHEIPNIKEKCDVWGVLPIKYVRQFTGLLDKNGREIYEGDICLRKGNPQTMKPTYLNRLFTVVFSEQYAEFKFKQHELLPDGEIWKSHVRYEVEVIGNIYENPELINAKTN